MRAQHSALETSLASATTNVLEAESQIDDLKHQLVELHAAVSQANEDTIAAQKELERAENVAADATASSERLAADLHRADTERAVLTAALEETGRKLKFVEAQQLSLESQVESAVAESKTKLEALETEKTALELELLDTTTRLRVVEAERTALETSVESAAVEVAQQRSTLQSELAAATSALVAESLKRQDAEAKVLALQVALDEVRAAAQQHPQAQTVNDRPHSKEKIMQYAREGFVSTANYKLAAGPLPVDRCPPSMPNHNA